MKLKDNEPDFVPVDFDYEWQEAPWLGSDFNSDCWLLFGSICVDWRVKIDDGSLLTDSANGQVCQGLKAALMLYLKGGHGWDSAASPSITTLKVKCRAALSTIDLILLTSSHLKLSTAGLSGLTGSNLKAILEQIASHPSRSESIYQWTKSVFELGLEFADKLGEVAISSTLEVNPFLRDDLEIYRCSDIEGGGWPSEEELLKMRVAFYMFGYYNGHKRTGLTLDSSKLKELLYANTLIGKSGFTPILSIFNCAVKSENYSREFDRAPVVTGSGISIGREKLGQYKGLLCSFGGLPLVGLPGPSSIDILELESFTLQTRKSGRFRTLSADSVFRLLRQSIEFHLSWGEEIVHAFCRLAEYAMEQNILLSQLSNDVVQLLVGERLRSFGVTTLGLSVYSSYKDSVRIYKESPEEHYNRIRSNQGLNELLRVYVGAAQFCIGLLAARRQDELAKMRIDQCLDVTRSWLVFDRAKSTVGLDGRRDTIARPIDPLGVAMLENLLSMQTRLMSCGYISQLMTAFSVPSLRGRKGMLDGDKDSMSVSFDLFCDYFQSDKNQFGQRYYIRQHQLRRMFALLFFHAYGIGGMDTLRWMLGHTDLEHLWRYLTDMTDGASLRGAEAQHIAKEIRAKDDGEYEDLRSMLSEHFGTTYLAIIDAGDLEDRILYLMEEKQITVEPQFIRTNNGEFCKFLVHVKGDKPWLL